MHLGYLDQKRESSLEQIRARSPAGQIHRLDLGQNNDGCDPEVARYLAGALRAAGSDRRLKDYPPYEAPRLREKISELHGVSSRGVLITAGIEQAIGLIANALLGAGDRVLVADPSFFVFEAFSIRNGARPLHIALDEEDGFRWGSRTFDRFREALHGSRARVVWLADPNNPTGRSLPPGAAEEIVAEANRRDCVVVVDEAYGEYTDHPGGVDSASSLLHRFPRVIVLRTFSKAFGLAGLRVGCAICEDRDLLDAVAAHGYNFPVSRLSVDAAAVALERLEHLETTRLRTRARSEELLATLGASPELIAVPTECCIFMVRHRRLDAAELTRRLERQGIVTSRIPGTGRVAEDFIRITIGDERENRALIAAFSRIEEDGSSCPNGRAGDRRLPDG